MDVRALSVLVAHADRCWKAEEANSTRLANKANLLMTATVATIGFNLYILKELVSVYINQYDLIAGALLVTGAIPVLALICSLYNVLNIRAAQTKNRVESSIGLASARLHLPPPPHPSTEYTEDEVLQVSFLRTYDAASELFQRNSYRSQRLMLAQNLLFLAIVFLAAFAGVYKLAQLQAWKDSKMAPLHQPADTNGQGKSATSGPTLRTSDQEFNLQMVQLFERVKKRQEEAAREAQRTFFGFTSSV